MRQRSSVYCQRKRKQEILYLYILFLHVFIQTVNVELFTAHPPLPPLHL